jgi:hypothetical protein
MSVSEAEVVAELTDGGATGRFLLAFTDLPQEVTSLTFRPDGTAMTALIGDEVRTWQAAALAKAGK